MDWITLGIFAAFLVVGFILGLVIGFPLGHRHIINQFQRRSDEERKARLDQVKERADARLHRATANAAVRRRKYGILEERELS